MKKPNFPIEFVLLGVSVIITAIAVLFIFKPAPKDYVKLIKWSQESTLEGILDHTSRRMFPVFSETRSVKIIKPTELNLEIVDLSNIFKSVTQLPFTNNDINQNQLNVLSSKSRDIEIQIQITKEKFNMFETKTYFDEPNLKKIINKINDKNLDSSFNDFLFSLYQSGPTTYTLDVIDFKN